MRQRPRFDEAFKANAALEALKEEKTLQELADEYEAHPNQITRRKKQLLEGAPELFECKSKKNQELDQAKRREQELYNQLGQAKYENQWLKKSRSSCTAGTTNDRSHRSSSVDRAAGRPAWHQPLL